MSDSLDQLKIAFLDEISNELRHSGVKGMRWGHRKASSEASGSSPKPAKMTRKEVKADKAKFYQEKGNRLVQTALKDPKTLIMLNSGGTHPTVVTGKEFITHLQRGGLMNIKATDVYATQSSKDGPYVLNAAGNQTYKRP